MNDATLNAFREIAKVMHGSEPQDWQWTGKFMSQRMFGISEKRAREYARIYDGEAVKMETADPYPCSYEGNYEK